MPHAGTWIEIVTLPILVIISLVVPHAGTWIEIIQAQNGKRRT